MMIADLAIILLIVSVPLFAHHGNAAFDTGKKLTVTGWTWGNPHIYLKFDVRDRLGKTPTSATRDFDQQHVGTLSVSY
jgi:hypothetical protein